MKPSSKVTIATGLILLFCLAGSVLARRRVDQARPSATLDEVLYLNSPKAVKRLSLGYDGIMANLYWTRAVQYFGTHHHLSATQYNLLPPLLQITTALDPELTVAYHFGANFLAPRPPNGAGMPDKAIELVNYGIQHNPNDWKLYYDLGFIYYLELKDYAKASEAFERGSKVPNAHPFLRVLAAKMASHAGEIETARMLWTAAYENTQDKAIRNNALGHLRALRVDEDITELDRAVALYRDKYGRVPTNMVALETSGLMPRIPLDPTGRTYKLIADGRIEVRVPDALPFIEKGLPPDYRLGVPKLEDLEK